MKKPYWVLRASDDDWHFGVELSTGTKIAFNSLFDQDFEEGFVRLETTECRETSECDEDCIVPNERGMHVRVDSVIRFWERETT